ncbi:hypothetical protein CARUB_v10003814mg [Capsella rubella]|uniref:F-box domain-containing protein n=1 Tax=Capsella rubella TaxID=81985 RepID=R0H1G1_9BRAS|nr:hypothetical protein CARUB_v10003814mg [Capsella rubella]
MRETNENCGGRIEEITCEDRISALPDDVLVTILFSIPTKDAVATMILSKRWRFIWTMVPFLAYKESDDDGSKKKSVYWFLDKSMESHKAPVLAILSIRLGPQCPSDANVGKWVESAINRSVWVLFFKLVWSADPTRMPISLYTCKTLLHLQLSHKILVDPPCTSSLPLLGNLDLYYVVYKDEASLVALLSSCPVLRYLCVKRKKDDNIATFSVKVPSLRSLVLDTPALRDFYITDRSGNSFSIKNMPCLQYAFIKGKYFPDIDQLLRPLSAVLSLELVLTHEMAVCCGTIKFFRLIKCKLVPCNSDWMESLVPLLRNTPKLKSLIVDYRSTSQASNAYPLWSSDPECLSSSLEEFEMINYGGIGEEEDLVAYILENAKCLKKATISFIPEIEDCKDIFIDRFEAIHRVSKASQLFF